MPFSGAVSDDLLLTAEAYSYLGYSVIPLLGDAAPDRPKAPAVAWASYQFRRAGLPDFERWFMQEGYRGLAIVTGRISNLVVLDFDDLCTFNEFSAQCSDLVSLQVIQTRRGYHIYFHLPPHLYLPTRKGHGVDLLADGCYVVARPTVIAGHEYKLVRGGQPKSLTEYDLKRITIFLNAHSTVASSSVEKITTPLVVKTPRSLTKDELQAFYCAQVRQGRGRNDSLFNITLTARDHGWSPAEVQSALVGLHISTNLVNHPPETDAQRQREAVNTIKSAFSRPARPPRPLPVTSLQLPTRVREALYARGLTCVVRTIEGLREKGIQPGQTFTRRQALTLLRGMVGRDSIDHTLKTTAPDGQPLIAREVTPPLEPPPASNDAADAKSTSEIKKCFFDGAPKSGKMLSGRKPRIYIMPTSSQLCHKLGVPFSISDPMQPDDFASAKKTRQATHREFIKRRPGQYNREWLAKRLGISVRTLQRYNIELHIQVEPMFDERPITWDTLDDIPDEPVASMFLQDDKNLRYPALRGIALYLLPRVRALYLMRQEANFYSLDPPNVVFNQIWQYRKAQQEKIEQAITVEQGRAENLPARPVYPGAQPRSGLPPPAAISAPQAQTAQAQSKKRRKPVPKLSKRRARLPLPNALQEALAQHVYTTINARTADKRDRISQASARRAVFTYGVPAVQSALKHLSYRHNLYRPVGFFMTILRSEHKNRT